MISATHLLYILAAALLVVLGFYHWTRRRLYYLASKIPGPPSLPLFGNMLELAGSPEVCTRKTIEMYNRVRKTISEMNVPIGRIWLGPMLVVFIDDADAIDQVLKNNLQKSRLYHMLDPMSAKGIFLQYNIPEWKKNRKIIAPTFHFSVLKTYLKIFFEEASILADKMKGMADGKQAFEPVYMMGLATFSMVLRSTIGVNFNVQLNPNHPYLQAVETVFEIFQIRMYHPWLQLDFFHSLFGYKRKELKYCQIAKDFATKIIEQIKTQLKDNDNLPTNEEKDDERPLSFAELIIKEQLDNNNTNPKMDDEQLRDEIITIVNAGLDTTKTTNSIILNILGVNQQIQDEVYKEIQSVFGDDIETPPTYDQLQELVLLDRVIKETLRLYPAAPVIGRNVAKETDVAGYTIPVGTIAGVFIYGIHRHPKYWDTPDKFDPDRFLPEQVAKRKANAFIPFSTAPRNCIGYKYAMMQMKTTISTLLRRYKVLPGDKCKTMDDIKYEISFTLRVLPGNDIKLLERHPIS